jgi:hypothetical protein
MTNLTCFKTGGRCTERRFFKARQVFAAYPFDDDHHWLFDEVVKPVVEGLKGKTGRYNLKLTDARSQTNTRDFMCSIAEEIWSSRFYIIDLSKENGNVYLELGMMLGHCQTDPRRRFVLISSFEERLTADISSVNVVKYNWHDLEGFKERLTQTCLETFKAVAPTPPQPKATPVSSPTAPSDRYDSLLGGAYFRRGGLSLSDPFVNPQSPSLSELTRRLLPPSSS